MGRKGVVSYRGDDDERPIRNSTKLKEGFAAAMAEAERFAGELGSKFQRSLNRKSNKSMSELSVEDVDFVPAEVKERKRWWPFGGGTSKKKKEYSQSDDEEIDLEVSAPVTQARQGPKR